MYRITLIATLLVSLLPAQNAKRALTHADFDAWRSISNQRLSPDGRYVAYGVFPQEGDGEVVVRNLATGQETREPAGQRPVPPPANPASGEERPPAQRVVTMGFTEDSRTLVFLAFPPRAEVEKAKRDKTPGDHNPKDTLVIVGLAGGTKATRIARVKSFQLPAKAAGYLAYLHEAPETKPGDAKKGDAEKKEGEKKEGGDADQRGGAAAATRPGTRARQPEFGSELVLRQLAGTSERSFADVVEYSLAEDGTQLVYAVSAKEAAGNGLYAVRTASADAPVELLKGKGKYVKVTWDEKQTQLAFLSSHDDPEAKQPKWKIYRWDRKAAAAETLVDAATPGFRSEFVISDHGNLAFSQDGSRLFFGAAPPAPPEKSEEANAIPAEDKVAVDLWHWKDDFIQPMQKVRATRDRNRTYTAAYLIDARKVVQLGDAALPEIVTGESSAWALGNDDRAYRRMEEYDERYLDILLVNVATGERRLLAKKRRNAMSWSPAGRYALYFDGQNWHSVSVPDGKDTNLTATLGVKFYNEDHDTPNMAPAYGAGGWTRDGQWVLLYDRFDVWQVAPDGSGARNLTAGAGRRQGLQFRHVRFAKDDDPRDRWIDPAQPMLLRAESLVTRESGFFRTRFGATIEPQRLTLQPRYFTPPTKAAHAEVYLLSGQSFAECPDLLVTDAKFHEFRKVSGINPRQNEFLWGKAEMVRFENSDGVPLSGVLYKPENFDPKKKYPMLVYIYERMSQQLFRYMEPRPSQNINISYYVSNGYLVLTPDIVYTTGYPGQSALKAVLPAVQSIVDRGFVDEHAIGIQGHSWGGYQIAYMITQTNRFRAVAAGAPVSNMISAYDGIRWGPGLPRQFQYERSQSRIGGSIWEYPTRYIENSPIFWADRVQTPVMMLHNDGDDAVPWYQGIEYYLALRRLGKEVYLFTYNGEPHGIRRRPNLKDYARRLQEYFDHYLKGAPAPAWMEKGIPYLERQ